MSAWCICYARITAESSERMTACRASAQACRRLEQAVAAGRSGMVARSLTHVCQELQASHPGDVYGGRAAWKASKKEGGWLSTGACQLPGEGEPVQAEGGPNPMGDEVIGGLRHGMPAEEVLALLGEPAKRGRVILEMATGTYIQEWLYKDKGVRLSMGADTRKGPQRIHTLRIKAPSELTTRFGVGVGSPRKAVLAAYGKLRDPFEPSGDAADEFIAGSVYGGVFFTFVADKVTEIFVGAGAE
ncbi:MAG: hypothetical protein H0T76_04835 [Nannocystis sp.]|nr:hypothetical protein [Nannocystis sp.]